MIEMSLSPNQPPPEPASPRQDEQPHLDEAECDQRTDMPGRRPAPPGPHEVPAPPGKQRPEAK